MPRLLEVPPGRVHTMSAHGCSSGADRVPPAAQPRLSQERPLRTALGRERGCRVHRPSHASREPRMCLPTTRYAGGRAARTCLLSDNHLLTPRTCLFFAPCASQQPREEGEVRRHLTREETEAPNGEITVQGQP